MTYGVKKKLSCVAAAAAGCLMFAMVCRAQAPIVIDFEDENMDQWIVVDEPDENLGDATPSTWEIVDTQLAFDGNIEGKVLTQGSNTWGGPNDHMLLGPIILFGDQEFTNFKFEADVIANDNDGLGPIWGYKDLDQHDRIQMMNDRWPEIEPLDGHHGPMIIAHRRISNESPWYEVLEVIDDPAEYIPYPEGAEMHWTLEVNNGDFTFTSEDVDFGDVMEISGSDPNYTGGLVGFQLYAESGVEFDNVVITPLGGATLLQPGDADQDLDFDQLDLVKVQIAAKYLTGNAATWGEGDWNGAPGGAPGNPPAGNGLFDQLDIISALSAGKYLTGPYGAINTGGNENDEQTSIIYNATTGELGVNAPASTELTSVNIDSAAGIFTGDPAENLGGSFDNDADNNIFKATFGGSFGSLSFGTVAQPGLSEEFVAGDLTVVGSLAGGGDLGAVDLIYVPEPSSLVLLVLALAGGALLMRRRSG